MYQSMTQLSNQKSQIRNPQSPIRNFLFLLFTFYFLLLIGCKKSTTNPLPPAGPDTTSHNFTWQIDTIGIRNSVLFDVAVINENNTWAVGEIHTAETDTFDSLGNWIPPFNAVHWNGIEWEMKRFMKENNGNLSIIIPVRSIWHVADNNIWLAAGSIYHWDGEIAQLSYLRNIGTNETVEKLWYNSQNNIYGIGNEGLIVHYNGSSWQKQESGTNVNLTDIWGSGPGNIWVCGHETSQFASVLLHYDGNSWNTIWRTGMNSPPYSTFTLLHSLWFSNGDSLWIVGDSLYSQSQTNFSSIQVWNVPFQYFQFAIRGSAYNNIFVAGDHGMLWHYNGANWRNYPQLMRSGQLNSLVAMPRQVIIVGFHRINPLLRKALIYRGSQ